MVKIIKCNQTDKNEWQKIVKIFLNKVEFDI